MSKLKLAILDDYQGVAAAKFEHLWSQITIESFPDTLNAAEETTRAQLIQRLEPFDIICTMRERTRLPKEVIQSLPNLKLITTTGMHNAAIDLEACKIAGIAVLGTKGQVETSSGPKNSYDSTTEQTWALILGLARNVAQLDSGIRSGAWQMGFAIGLKGKTLGILGFGRLGAETARIGIAFGMKCGCKAKELGFGAGAFKVAESKLDLFSRADVLSIHYVLSERSRGIVGRAELDAMKNTALLINTSRGPLIDENALYEALLDKRIAGYAADVFDIEPLPLHSRWREPQWREGGQDRSLVLLSPHMGYVEEDVIHQWYQETASHVEQWLAGADLDTRMV